MKPFDPDYSAISNEQLAKIDLHCSEYETSRTKGFNVSIKQLLSEVDEEIREPLRRELIQIEMEILDAWDQLHSPDDLIGQFPEQCEFIKAQWELLTSQQGVQHDSISNRDTNNSSPSTQSVPQPTAPITSTAEDDLDEARKDDPSPRFRVVRNLAQGGIGTVFVAFDRDLQREVAIKELKRRFANDRSVLQRFEAEATVIGNLEHPNIVPIYATGKRSDGRPFYAMRLIHGRSMLAVISEMHREQPAGIDFRKNATAKDLILRFINVCRAMGFAHSKGILHRDLKPSNIMVGDFGETLIVDWGLARLLGSQASDAHQAKISSNNEILDAQKTAYGTIIGTPGYMSPEQSSGHHEELTVASDIYSLGATLFHILTNTAPDASSANQTAQSRNPDEKTSDPVGLENKPTIVSRSPLPHSASIEYRVNVPKGLAAICDKALRPRPSERYINAECLANDLQSWVLDEPVSVLPETPLQKTRRWARSHPAIVASAVASLVISLIAMGITLRILSSKNESLRLSNDREHQFAEQALNNEAVAKRNGDEAIRQRQRVLAILNTFLIDIERGLANVPGSAAVQRNVLTTVLNKLGEVSIEFSDDQLNLSNAMALIDLGDLFSRVGTKDIKLNVANWNQSSLSPLEAAEKVYAEALIIAKRASDSDALLSKQTIARIQQRQAEVFRQTARIPEAILLLEESLATRREILAQHPDDMEASFDVITSIDILGQIHLKDGDVKKATAWFSESRNILEELVKRTPNDSESLRRLGVAYSRIADIAMLEGNLDTAEELYAKDLTIAKNLYEKLPNNLTTKRDLCTSLDRLGNIIANRGQPEKAMESYRESRRLRQELHQAEPTNSKTMHELFVSCMKCGDNLMLINDVDSAQSDYADALLLANKMAELDPQNLNARRFQSISAEVLADVALSRSQLDDALRYAKQSLDISKELLARSPTDGQMQRDLYICYAKVAKVLQAKKEFAECQLNLNAALEITNAYLTKQPDSMQALGDHSFVLLKRAEAFLESGETATAATELQSVLQLLESVPKENRQDAKSRRRIANTLTLLGRALIANNEKERALQALERSRQLTTEMINENVRVDQMQIDLDQINEIIASLNDNP